MEPAEPGEPIVGVNVEEILSRILSGRKDPRYDVPVKKLSYSERWKNTAPATYTTESRQSSDRIGMLGNTYFIEEDYSDLVKDRCFICGRCFKNSWKDYKLKGNTCRLCDSRIELKLKNKPVDRSARFSTVLSEGLPIPLTP